MTSIRSGWIALWFLPCALAQSAGPPRRDLVDKVLGLVEPTQEAHLSAREQFHLYLAATVGPAPILGEAAGAAISQWMNSPEEWGQGWGAYGKRVWSNLAYNGLRQTITYGASVALGEDNRYFVSRKTGFLPRVGHALLSTVTAQHADGRRTVSYSAVAGIVGSSAIASAWGPPGWKGPGHIAENAGISFASTAGFNIFREFLPDILGRRRK